MGFLLKESQKEYINTRQRRRNSWRDPERKIPVRRMSKAIPVGEIKEVPGGGILNRIRKKDHLEECQKLGTGKMCNLKAQ